MRFLNRKVLVTGSSRGIGRAIALQLAREGAQVVIHYTKNREAAEAVVKEINEATGSAFLLKADISDPIEVTTLGKQAWELLDGIDILINNAGISYKKHFLDHTMDDVSAFIDTNLKGTLYLTQVVARQMVMSNRPGSIYTMTSINGIQPGVGQSVYGATKGALETLMKGVALELAPHDINVNTVVLGGIATDMNAAVHQDPEKLAEVEANIPMGRLGNTTEVAKVICGLIADGSYMTGSSIKIDGGWLLKHGYQRPELYR